MNICKFWHGSHLVHPQFLDMCKFWHGSHLVHPQFLDMCKFWHGSHLVHSQFLDMCKFWHGSHLVHPQFLVGFVLLDLWFYMYVLLIVVCPFVLFLLAIVLSVLLQCTDSDYHFGIFKLFLVFFINCAHI